MKFDANSRALFIIPAVFVCVVAVIIFFTTSRGSSVSKPDEANFTLTAHTGKKVSLHDFKNKLTLIFFGYTHCPDVCPTVLNDMDKVMKLVGEHAKELQVLFISVDPERDTVKELAEYMGYFNPSFIGLTGTMQEIKNVANMYDAAFFNGPKDKNGDYAVGHSGSYYLIDKTGALAGKFPHQADPEHIAEVVMEFINNAS